MPATYKQAVTGVTPLATTVATVTVPTNTAIGDVAYIAVSNYSGTNHTAPAGIGTFTAIGQTAWFGDNLGRLSVWRRIITPGDVTLAGSAGSWSFGAIGAVGRGNSWGVLLIAGADLELPEDVSSVARDDVSDFNDIAPSVSPSTDNSLLLCFWTAAVDSSNYTVPGTMTKRFDLATASAFPLAGATQLLSASGATGTQTAVHQFANSASAGASICVRAARPRVRPGTVVTRGAVSRASVY